MTLECELSKPDQKVKWLKDGKEIKPDRKRNIIPKVEGTKHSLTIPKSMFDDTGVFSVMCGDQETKGKLTVESKLCGYTIVLFMCKNLQPLSISLIM